MSSQRLTNSEAKGGSGRSRPTNNQLLCALMPCSGSVCHPAKLSETSGILPSLRDIGLVGTATFKLKLPMVAQMYSRAYVLSMQVQGLPPMGPLQVRACLERIMLLLFLRLLSCCVQISARSGLDQYCMCFRVITEF